MTMDAEAPGLPLDPAPPRAGLVEEDRRPDPAGETAGDGRRSGGQRPNSPRSRPFAVSLAAGLAASCGVGATAPEGISIAVDLLRTRTFHAGRQSRAASAGRGWARVRSLP